MTIVPELLFAVTIDTECDKGLKWRVRQPLSFANIMEGVPMRLQPLFEDYGVKPTYLLSPEVLQDDACVSLFRGLSGSAELGAHLHSEFVEPDADAGCQNTKSFLGDYPPAVQRAKLDSLTGLFTAAFGRRPTSFRAGRFALSPYTLGFLEDLGYRVDSSVTPYTWWWRRRGWGVNFLGAPNQPYHPSRIDARVPGEMRIIEVPVTLINQFWERWPNALLRAIDPLSRVQTIALNTLLGNRLKCSWLRPTFATADDMLAVVDHMCALDVADRLVLCMMFHSNEATAGMSPYHDTASDVSSFIDRMKEFFDILSARHRVRFVGLSDVPMT